jgi:hypothetical protein
MDKAPRFGIGQKRVRLGHVQRRFADKHLRFLETLSLRCGLQELEFALLYLVLVFL